MFPVLRLKKLRAAILVTRLLKIGMYNKLPLPPIQRRLLTFDNFADGGIPIYFRFRNKDQLQRLKEGFRIPDVVKTPSRHKFTGHEILIIGLYKLHQPTTLTDSFFKETMGLSPTSVSIGFHWFLNHLLTNNLAYWKPQLHCFADAIKNKIGLLNPDIVFPPVLDQNGFAIFGFIDNKMEETCRPGGGPAADGQGAPRNDPLLSRSWYTGWKKTHGMKWQSVDLPNGMTFHLWGGCSIRHNDLWTLRESKINEKIALLQTGSPHQFMIYGDSIYPHRSHIRHRFQNDPNTAMENAINKAMSSCRESIEWNYGDLKKFWAALDFKNRLRLRQMPIAKLFVCALLLQCLCDYEWK
jgi:hypothetical protein